MPAKGIKIPRACQHCGSHFLVNPSRVIDGKARYCSHRCRDLGQMTRIPRTCKQCGVSFAVKASQYNPAGNFCTHRCSLTWLHGRPPRPFKDQMHSRSDMGGEHWLWQGPVNNKGYGVITVRSGNGGHQYIHRAAWFLASGRWSSAAEQIGHTCDVPRCWRNDEAGIYEVNGVAYPRFGHLFLCPSAAVNAADMIAKGRSATGERNGAYRRPDRRPRGERLSALTDDQIISARNRYAAGTVTKAVLEVELGIRRRQVNRILTGYSWKHLL